MMENKVRLEDVLGAMYRRKQIEVWHTRWRDGDTHVEDWCVYRGECGDYESDDNEEYYVLEIKFDYAPEHDLIIWVTSKTALKRAHEPARGAKISRGTP